MHQHVHVRNAALALCLAALVCLSASAAEARRKVAVGGELLHERGVCELPPAIAENLSLRPDFTARVLTSDAQLPWLTRDGLAKLAPGEVAAWVTLSLYGTRYEIVAFVVDEKGRFLGTVHRQATTRVIPGEGGRFDRVPPGPKQYLQNATVEIAADIAALLRSRRPARTTALLPVVLSRGRSDAAELPLDQQRAFHAFLAVLAHLAFTQDALRPVLVEGGDKAPDLKPPVLTVSVLGAGPLTQVFGISGSLKQAGRTVTCRVDPISREELLQTARRFYVRTFDGGDRVLRTWLPGEEVPAALAPPPAPPEPRRKRRPKTTDELAGDDWSFPLPDVLKAGPVETAERVYLGCRNGEVYALEAATGRTAWRAECDDVPCFLEPTDGPLVTGDVSGNLYAFDAAGSGKRTRRLLWKTKTTAPVLTKLDLPGKALVWLALEDGRIISVGTADGKVQSQAKLPERFGAPPVVDGSSVIAATVSGRLYRVRPDTGAVEPLVSLLCPVDGPLTVRRNCKLQVSALDTIQTDIVTAKDAEGDFHAVSLTDRRRPRVRLGGKTDIENPGENTGGFDTKLEVGD